MADGPDFSAIPAVGTMLDRPAIAGLARTHGRTFAVRVVREAVDEIRGRLRAGSRLDGDLEQAVEALAVARAHAASRSSLRRVLNATGVVVHTNLGRAPLAAEAIAAAVAVAGANASLEIDLDTGKRGDRHGHVVARLVELTGAEDALVVNNGAAAVLLAMTALARDREVVVSRGELVEIGGGFRVPDVITSCGATLVEVGTTNRTHAADYERAIGDKTACLLKVHRSNFAVVGFVAEVSLADVARIAHARGLPCVYDAGSGLLGDLDVGEPTIADAVRAGADVIAFSGDKLLGGPQAGVLVGTRAMIASLRKHPLVRALRPDKLTIAALAATLDLWRTDPKRIPVVRAITTSIDTLEARSNELARKIGPAATVVPCSARIGGGAAPDRELPSRAVRIVVPDADGVARALRTGEPSVVARIEEGAVMIDLRCVPDEDDSAVAEAVARALEDRS